MCHEYSISDQTTTLCQRTDWGFNWSICNTLRSYKWQSSPCRARNPHTIRRGGVPEVQPWTVCQENRMCLLPLVYAGSQAAVWSTPPRPAPVPLLGLGELQQAHMPLQCELSLRAITEGSSRQSVRLLAAQWYQQWCVTG